MSLTDDAFLGGSLMLLQPKRGYRAGVDAVMLAAAVPRGGAMSLLDLGAGVGTAGLCVARQVDQARIVLLEREAEFSDLAHQNVLRNGLAGRARVVCGDISSLSEETLRTQGLAPDTFDHVIANPPYHAEGAGTLSSEPLKARAHAMPEADLEAWCRFMARMARPGGMATVINKVEMLSGLLKGFDRRFGGLRVLPIYAREAEPAIRVLVQGVKGSKAPLQVLPGAVLHEADNTPTLGAEQMLRLGAALDLDYWKGFARAPSGR